LAVEADIPRSAPEIDRRTLTVLAVSVVLLIVFEYWGLASRFAGSALHDRVAEGLGEGYRPYVDLLPYQYWGVSSLVLRVLVPLGVIAWWLRESPRHWGFRLRGQWRHIRPYVFFLVAMIPVLLWASTLQSFQDKYPFYDGAVLGGWHFWGFQLFYGLQFLGVECFFRGFMLFGLERRFGWYAIGVMVIPYVMIHFGKPAPETFAAIVAGVLLGYMALRSRSFLWGVMVHWSVGIMMDAFVIGREIGFAGMLGRVF
jgi:membrane protease YdiL (CAAX protease family)